MGNLQAVTEGEPGPPRSRQTIPGLVSLGPPHPGPVSQGALPLGPRSRKCGRGTAGQPESLTFRSAQARWAAGQPGASFRGGGLPTLSLTFRTLWAVLGAPTAQLPPGL